MKEFKEITKTYELMQMQGEDKLKKDADYWKQISKEIARVRNKEVIKLVRVLRPIPKTVWQADFDRIIRDIDKLRDTLQRKADKYGIKGIDFY